MLELLEDSDLARQDLCHIRPAPWLKHAIYHSLSLPGEAKGVEEWTTGVAVVLPLEATL